MHMPGQDRGRPARSPQGQLAQGGKLGVKDRTRPLCPPLPSAQRPLQRPQGCRRPVSGTLGVGGCTAMTHEVAGGPASAQCPVSTSAALNAQSALVPGGEACSAPLCPPQLPSTLFPVLPPVALGALLPAVLGAQLGAWPSPQGTELGPKEGTGEVACRGNPAPCPRDRVQPSL